MSGRAFAVALAVAALWIGSALHRFERATAAPGWPDPVHLHRSEAAVHYRYARELATGAGVPAVDRRLEWPAGVRPRVDFTLTMESGVALFHRLFGGDRPLVWSIAVFVAAISAASVALEYGLARAIHGSHGAGLLSAVLVAASAPVWLRSSGAFLRENLSLPLGLAAALLLVLDASRPHRARWIAAVGCLTLFLVTWHLSSFLLVLAVAPLWLGLLAGRRPARPLWAVTAATLVAVLVSEPLRSRGLPLEGVGPVLLVGGPLAGLRHGRRIATGVAGLLLAALALSGSAGAPGDYGHVFEVVRSRLEGTVDPAELSFSARAFRSGPFAPPSLADALERLALPLAAALAGLGATLRRPHPTAPWLAGCALVFGAATLAMGRFASVWILFLAPVAAAPFRAGTRGGAGRVAGRAITTVLSISVVAVAALWDRGAPWRPWLSPLAPGPTGAVSLPSGSTLLAMDWIRARTDPEAVILAHFALSPTIVLATDRAVPLHPMFERAAIRERARRYHEALMGSPTSLERFCAEVEADFLLVDVNLLLDASQQGARFLGGVRAVPSGSAAVRIWLEPEALGWAETVYADDHLRVLALSTGRHPLLLDDPARGLPEGPPGVGAGCARRPSVHPSVLGGGTIEDADLDPWRAGLRRGRSLSRRAAGLARAGRTDELARLLPSARALLPCDPLLAELARRAAPGQGPAGATIPPPDE